MKVLVVEDEKKLANYLRRALAETGHIVDVVHAGHDGLHLAQERCYDVILLDWMLPGLDGLAVLKEIRIDQDTPILLLTARGTVEDRVQGLEAGADDYLVKPFALSELLARIQALGRRASKHGKDALIANKLVVADLELDQIRRKVTRGDRRIELTPKEFSLLALLMRKQGQVLSRLTLAEQVWDIHFNSNTNVIDVAVRRLRVKVDDPFSVKLLHTVRGVGYVCEQRADEE